MQVEGQLDPSIYATGAYVDDNKAQLNAFAFQSMKTGQVKLGAQKAFSSGTALKGELSYSDIETEAINAQAQVTGTPTVTSKFEEADLIFEIQQSLLNNSFGSATRSQLSASEAQAGSVVQQYRLDLGQWMVSTAEIYYNAWFAQRRVEASRHTLEIQKRLLKITKILKNRGVSHQADLLQVEGAVIAAENALREDVNQLNNVWRQLIIYLKLDPAFLKIDPSKIPIVQGDYYKQAKYLCKKSSEKNFLKTSLPRFKKLDLDYKAVKGQLDSSKNLTLPDLNLAFSIDTNGVKRVEGGQTSDSDYWSDTLNMRNPKYTVALNFNMPIFNNIKKSDVITNFKNLKDVEYSLSKTRDDVRVQWANDCKDIERLEDNIKYMKIRVDKENKREQLEENRFKLGKVDVLNIIQASRDQVTALIALQSSQAALYKKIWVVKELHGDVEGYLAGLKKRFKQ